MFTLMTTLAGFSIICLCPVIADRDVSLRVDRRGGSSFTVNFNGTVLDQLHGCLCDDAKYSCTVQVSKDDSFVSVYRAYSPTGQNSLLETAYSNIFNCYVRISVSFPFTPLFIRCTRLTPIVASYSFPPSVPCQSFSLMSKSPQTCDLDCVDVRWTVAQTVTVTELNTETLSCGVCGLISSTTTSTAAITTTTSSSMLSLSTVNSKENGADEIDNDVLVLVSVLMAVFPLIIVVPVMVVLLLRKRRRSNSTASNSSVHYVNPTADNLEPRSTPTGHKVRGARNSPAEWRYENAKRANDREEAIITSEYSCVPSVEFKQHKSHVHESTEVQAATKDGIVQESDFTNTKNQNLQTPDIYAKLHAEVRNFQNPYDTLMSSKENFKSKPPQEFTSSFENAEEVQYSLAEPAFDAPAYQGVDDSTEKEDIHQKQSHDHPISCSAYEDVSGHSDSTQQGETNNVTRNDGSVLYTNVRKRGKNTEKAGSLFDYATRTLLGVAEDPDGANDLVFVEDEMDTTNDNVEEPEYTNMKNQDMHNSDVYANLHEAAGNLQNPYHILLDTKDDQE